MVSANGRYVAFVSHASNLVPGDGNGVQDVFVRDTRTNTTERVSVSSAEFEADDRSNAQALAISPGGRYVAFTSFATNLASRDDDSICAPDPCPDVYLRDRAAGVTRLLVPFAGVPMPRAMVVSDGARFYAYDTSVNGNVVRCRRSPKRCRDVSVLPPSVKVDEADPNSFLGGMSVNGRFILFQKIGFNESPHPASMLAGGVFVRDVPAGVTHIISKHPRDGAGGFSARGRFVLFTSKRARVDGDTNHLGDVFVRNRTTGRIRRISVSSSGHQANGPSSGIGISVDGRFCLFASAATNLVAGDTNGARDIFLRDRRLGTTVRVDVSSSGGQSNRAAGMSALSADGRWVAFTSRATNLIMLDANAAPDAFIRGPLR